MKSRVLLLALSVSACAASPPSAAPVRQAVELAGRSAGAARLCVPIERLEGLRVSDSDPHMLIYGRGKTIWTNDLGPGCGFSVNDVLVTQSVSRYCRGDVVRSFDHLSRVPGPSCVLGDFVPYTR